MQSPPTSDDIKLASGETRPGDKLRLELNALLARVGTGDKAAFSDVYGRTSAKLFGVCLRMLNDRDLAEDALQESYIAVWNNAQSFDVSKSNAMTWLITLARNRAIDRLRRARAGVSGKSADLDAAFDLADAAPLADDAMMASQDGAALLRCLNQLDSVDSGFIRASFLKGATYAEIATRDDIPLGTIKSRIRRALVKLRVCLHSSGMETVHG